MLKRYFISYAYSSVNGFYVVYNFNQEAAVSEFYTKCKHCDIQNKAELTISEEDIDKSLLHSLEKSDLIEIITKLMTK